MSIELPIQLTWEPVGYHIIQIVASDQGRGLVYASLYVQGMTTLTDPEGQVHLMRPGRTTVTVSLAPLHLPPPHDQQGSMYQRIDREGWVHVTVNSTWYHHHPLLHLTLDPSLVVTRSDWARRLDLGLEASLGWALNIVQQASFQVNTGPDTGLAAALGFALPALGFDHYLVGPDQVERYQALMALIQMGEET